jgi:hypothetical protein
MAGTLLGPTHRAVLRRGSAKEMMLYGAADKAMSRRSQWPPDWAPSMGTGTGYILPLLSAALMLCALAFVVRAGVEVGIRRSSPDSALGPEADK